MLTLQKLQKNLNLVWIGVYSSFSGLTDCTEGRQGKEALQELTGKEENRAIYKALTEEEKKAMTDEFEKVKAMKSKASRISMKSRINDITQTVKSIENEVSGTDNRTFVYLQFHKTDTKPEGSHRDRGIILYLQGHDRPQFARCILCNRGGGALPGRHFKG